MIDDGWLMVDYLLCMIDDGWLIVDDLLCMIDDGWLMVDDLLCKNANITKNIIFNKTQMSPKHKYHLNANFTKRVFQQNANVTKMQMYPKHKCHLNYVYKIWMSLTPN